MQEEITVIILGYRRLYSLQRLLVSLVMAARAYNPERPVNLIISFDQGSDESVISFCKNFFSRYFTIQIKEHYVKLGVDKHNLWAMAQAENYPYVIILEDDTMVSPSVFHFAWNAFCFYNMDEKIAGISLYHYPRNEACNYPFYTLADGYDTYFYQRASSRGLLITREQWLRFKNFKMKQESFDLPKQYQNWSNEVWEKQFNTYLIQENKFWVHPHLSLTTNFGEFGTHVNKTIYRNAFQSAMQQGVIRNYRFQTLEKSNAVYDAFGEAVRISGLQEAEITSDIFGERDLSKIKTKYILTSRHCSRWEEGYALDLIPPELNITMNLRGQDLKMTEVKFIEENFIQRQRRMLKLHYYFYPDKGLLHLLRLKITEIINRINLF